jgi:hypothetical protein
VYAHIHTNPKDKEKTSSGLFFPSSHPGRDPREPRSGLEALRSSFVSAPWAPQRGELDRREENTRATVEENERDDETRRDETRGDEHARTGWNGTRSSGSAIAGERDRVEAQARTTTNAHELGRREDYQSGDDDGVHDDAHRGDSWRSG